MNVGQRIVDSLEQRHSSQDLLTHLVHGGLDTGRVILSKGLEGGVPGSLPGIVELVNIGLDFVQAAEAAPGPGSIDLGAQNTVPGLLEGGEFVADEAPELGAGALEDGQAVNGGSDVDALALDHVDLDVAGLGAVLNEGVGVGLAVDVHAHPAVSDDVDVGGVDVRVLLDEVGAEDGAEQLGGSHRVLLGSDVDGVLDGVGGDDDAVVGLGVAICMRSRRVSDSVASCGEIPISVRRGPHGVKMEGNAEQDLRGLDITLQQDADGHLDDSLDTGLLITVNLVNADIVLAVAGSSQRVHDCGGWKISRGGDKKDKRQRQELSGTAEAQKMRRLDVKQNKPGRTFRGEVLDQIYLLGIVEMG